MRFAGRIAALSAGALISTLGHADELRPSGIVATVANPFLIELAVWRKHASSTTVPSALTSSADYLDIPPPQTLDVSVQDSSTIGRIKNVRGISLLTLAKKRRFQIFLGVNDDGLVGIHVTASREVGDERYLELARMPYMKQPNPNKR